MNITKKQFKIINILLASTLVFIAIKIFSGISSNSGHPTAVQANNSFQNQNKISNIVLDTDAVNRSTLFTHTSEAKIDTSSDQSIPSSIKSLTLKGTTTGKKSIARALILNKQNDVTKLYKINDSVFGATLISISHDNVQLTYQQQTYHLSLNHLKLYTPNNLDHLSDQFKKVSAPKTPQDNSLETIIKSCRFSPYIVNNITKGIQISNLTNNPVAQAIGIKNNDVIKSINGQDFLSKQKAFQILQKLKYSEDIEISLLRNGKSKTISFSK